MRFGIFLSQKRKDAKAGSAEHQSGMKALPIFLTGFTGLGCCVFLFF